MILIKGVEMPKCCDECFALDDHGDYPFCLITQDQRGYTFRVREKRMPSCPFLEVSKHGRLIDADHFDERVRVAGGMVEEELTDDFKDGIQATLLLLQSEPTVIASDGGKV